MVFVNTVDRSDTCCNKTLRRKCIVVTVRCYIHELCLTIDDFDAELIYDNIGFRILQDIYLGVTWTPCPS